jgi:quercetin dioxygenase-like cupin family protein
MSTMKAEWQTDWDVASPPEIGYVSVRADEGAWVDGAWPQFEYRDLGLTDVSDGKLGGRHIRSKPAGPRGETGWHCHHLDFEFLFVLSGSITIEGETGETYRLGPGAAGHQPALFWHNESDASDDFECVQITVPGEPATITDRDAELPAREVAAAPIYTFDTPENYVLGAGPRRFFRYRDLGSRALTDGRIHIHVVRASEPGAGTGWHYHSMAQWFMILDGWSVIRVETMPKHDLRTLDSMCVGRGPEMRHNVAPFSGDYAVLELCIPAEYETIAVAPPEGADAPPEGAQE